jgi:ribonuclease D
MPAPLLITHHYELAAVAERLRQVPSLALDVEANGLHAYRPRLCTVQLAWWDGTTLTVAIVDALELDLAPLAQVLGAGGPVKLLHDLSFDARMLHEAGIVLGNVRDTSVAARFLGEKATGLSTLLSCRLGQELSKDLQGHDWARRPFTSRQLDYLAGDVRHLHRLDAALQKEVDAFAIGAEIAIECSYKLSAALAPARRGRPAYQRTKGYSALAPLEQAILRRLFMQRERLAEDRDVPPHRVAPSGALLAVARAKPRSLASLRRLASRFAGDPHDWLAAVRLGIDDGAPPEADAPAPPRLDQHTLALRKRLDAAVSRWRRSAAAARGVDEQVILPGHCMRAVVAVLADGASAERDALRGIEGFCAGRLERYGEALLELARKAHAEREAPPSP